MTSAPTPGAARPRPLERFLGAAEAAGGPFALLGVAPDSCTDEVVAAALDRQIARVNSHLQRDTPEADEVRLALHAAAAQLLDPQVRRQLLARWGARASAEPAARPASPAAPPPPTASAAAQNAQALLQHDAILALGLFGGWNRRTLRRLLSLAHRRGLSAAEAVAAITRIARFRPVQPARHPRPPEGFGMARGPGVSAPAPRPTAATRPTPPSSALHESAADDESDDPSTPLPEELDPFTALARRALLIGVAALAAIALGALAIFFAVRTPTPAPAPTPAVAGPAPAKPSVETPDKRFTAQGSLTETRKPVAAAPDPAPVDPAVLNRELAACAEGLKVAPDEAAARFERTITALGGQWPSMTHESLVSAHDSVVEFVYRSTTIPAMTSRAIQAVAGPAALLDGAYSPTRAGALPAADRIAPAIWSVGMLVRLSREPDLPATAKSTIESALTAALGPARPAIDPSFESGASAAVMAASRVLFIPAGQPSGGAAAADPETWRRWVRCATAAAGSDPALRSRFILTGLEGLLLDAPEPSADKTVLAAIGELAAALTWRADEESRPRLLRWFEDKRVSAADLNAVTAALATRSSAEGVDLTMVLSPVSSDRARSDLRERFALAWGVGEHVDKGSLALAWSKAAREAVAASFERSDPVNCLRQAVVLSRLSEAASWRWLGDANAADKIVVAPAEPVDKALADVAKNAPPRSASDTSGDGAWAEKYLAARRNIPLRLDLLQKLGKGGGGIIGPVDAEVLVQEAFVGSPAEVKQRAAELTVQYSGSPSLVNAVLEFLPRIPLFAANGKIVESVTARSLPGIRDPKWPVAARRALVERLMEQLATDSEYAAVDALASLMSLSYQGRNATTSVAVDPAKAPPPHTGAAQQFIAWRLQAEKVVPAQGSPVRLDLVDRRRAGRFGQAEGMVQAFAAEQASICEVMAYVIASERPARSDQIRLILSNLAQERRGASNILEQVRACERAMVQLWLVRLGEDAP